MRARLATLLAWVGVGVAVGGDLQGQTRPAYQNLRYDEDWSFLRDRKEGEEDVFDPIKYIPLTEEGDVWVSFGGQVRERLEGWNDFNFGAPPGADSDDLFLLSRFRYHADLHVTPYVRLFAEGKSAFSTDRDLPGGRRTFDVDEVDLQNGFADLVLGSSEVRLTFRGGRQELQHGRQRLVSPLDWTNTRRTFDGLKGILEVSGFTVSGFWTRLVAVRQFEFNKNDSEVDFFGVYATTGKLPVPGLSGLDLYWLGLKVEDAAFNGSVGSEDRHTFGGRLWGKLEGAPLDYELEGAYQAGDVGSADIDAFFVATQVGWTVADVFGSLRFYVGFDFASGDDSPGDGEVETANQLFPLGHAYLGYIDAVGRQNIIDFTSGFSFEPAARTSVKVDGHYFLRASDDDALYNAAGGVSRPGAAGSSSEVGQEIDLTLSHRLDRHIELVGGYSHFFAGDFIDQSGPDDDIDLAYVTLQFTF